MVNICNKSIRDSDNDDLQRFANKTLQDYEVISVIGSGSFGTCFKVRDKQTGELLAWKGIDYDELSESSKESLVSEINLLSQLQHPNIVRYYHHLVNHEAKSIFIVMECCEGGDLAQLISRARLERKRFEEQYIWRVLFQVCKALQVCHNKIKRGTILHRDIKPANIFLDVNGNAKLGDFGLARMLRHYESFADSFVGTPHYMSPELVKGTKYDRKSDVWSVGCLIYEMCALRPPFNGRKFNQLSANISIGKFNSIPATFSTDLQEIITFMLEVENDQRPSIEIVTRHPVLIRNIKDISNEFPKLIDSTDEFTIVETANADHWTDLSSTLLTDHNSFNEEYGQRRLSFSRVFTPDTRADLYYSMHRRNFPKSAFLKSDPELYETTRRDDLVVIQDSAPNTTKVPASGRNFKKQSFCSRDISEEIFEHVLQERFQAIRSQENLLKQLADRLDFREQQLDEREQRLQEREKSLQKLISANIEDIIESSNPKNHPCSINPSIFQPLAVESSTQTSPPPPPIPPRKPIQRDHDETYCTIEPNDTLLEMPTVAKIDVAALTSSSKTFSTLRKVTFQSPKKFIKYDIENVNSEMPKVVSKCKTNQTHGPPLINSTQMQVSVSSNGSDGSSSTHRRKSILSIFGLSRTNNKVPSTKTQITTAQEVPTIQKERQPFASHPSNILAKCEPSDLSNIWTKEHKRAAFDMLAAMNRAKREGESIKLAQRHKLRQSVRDRNTFQRNRMRRSLAIAPIVNGEHEIREHLLV